MGEAESSPPFRVIKRQFGYTKVRYRGLARNTAQVVNLFALSNLWMVRRQLLRAWDHSDPRCPNGRFKGRNQRQSHAPEGPGPLRCWKFSTPW